jgi:hypothetical protein
MHHLEKANIIMNSLLKLAGCFSVSHSMVFFCRSKALFQMY